MSNSWGRLPGTGPHSCNFGSPTNSPTSSRMLTGSHRTLCPSRHINMLGITTKGLSPTLSPSRALLSTTSQMHDKGEHNFPIPKPIQINQTSSSGWPRTPVLSACLFPPLYTRIDSPTFSVSCLPATKFQSNRLSLCPFKNKHQHRYEEENLPTVSTTR